MRLSRASSGVVTVASADAGTGTATSGADYTAITADTLTFTPGQTSKTVAVTVTGDALDEQNETIVLRLSNPSNAAFASGVSAIYGTGTITDDEVELSAPSRLAATATSTGVRVSWDSSNHEWAVNQYQLSWKEGNGEYGEWTDVGKNRIQFRKNVKIGELYTFRVRAVNDAYQSPASNEAVASGLLTPRSLRTTVTEDGVNLNWSNYGQDASIKRFQVRRKESNGEWGEWTDITGRTYETLSHSVTGLTVGVGYVFQVRSAGYGTATGGSNEAATSPPAKPAGLAAQAATGQVNLSWTNSNDGTIKKFQAQVKEGAAAWGAWTEIANSGSGTTRHSVTGLSTGTHYLFRVRAQSYGGSSPASDPATTTVPLMPTGLKAKAGDKTVTLEWTNPGDGTITKYRLQQKKGAGSYGEWTDISVSGASTAIHAHTVSGLDNGVLYAFRIRAVNGVGEGAASNAVTATPQSLPPTVAIGGIPPTVSSAAERTVTFTFSEPVTGFEEADVTVTNGSLSGFMETTARKVWSARVAPNGRGDLTVTVPANSVTDGQGHTGPPSEVTATAVYNAAPTFSSSATVTVNENQTTVITVAARDGDSPDAITGYAITGGADLRKFSITPAGGVLTFNTAPDFENPTDAASTEPVNAAGNNEYVVVVTGTSGTGNRQLRATQTIIVTVSNVDEAGTVTFDAATPWVGSTLTASVNDPDGSVSNLAWTWARAETQDGAFTLITGAASGAYTPVGDDEDNWLRATASYTDPAGPGKSAQAVTTNSARVESVTFSSTAPTVSAIAITSTPKQRSAPGISDPDTYGKSEDIEVTVTFDKAVTVTGSPLLKLDMGGIRAAAAYARGSGSAALVFRYTVVDADRDDNGVSVPGIYPLVLPLEGSIRSSGDGEDANLRHSGIGDQSGHKVDARVPGGSAPRIASISILSTPASGDTYGAGELIELQVTWDQMVTGLNRPYPTLDLTFGSGETTSTKTARIAISSGDKSRFRYTVQARDTDTDGISIPQNPITVPQGGFIRNMNNNADADLTYAGLTAQSGHKVNGAVDNVRPAKPSRLRAMAAPPANEKVWILLSWNTPLDATITGYKYRQKVGEDAWGAWTALPASAVDATRHRFDAGLTRGKVYTFKVRAVDAGGDGPESEEVAVTIPNATPGPTTGLTATPGPGSGEVTLSWNNPRDDSITGYQYRYARLSMGKRRPVADRRSRRLEEHPRGAAKTPRP